MGFQNLAYYFQKRKLRKSFARDETWFENAIVDAQKKNDTEEANDLNYSFLQVTDSFDQAVRVLRHKRVCREAAKLLVPLPNPDKDNDQWEKSDIDGRWTLSDSTLYEMEVLIRREKRERAEILLLWPSIIIGILGGILGVAAFFLTYVFEIR